MAQTPVRHTPTVDARTRRHHHTPTASTHAHPRSHWHTAFYGRAIGITMMVELGTIASKQTKGTYATAQAITQLLNYASAHPVATVRYHASDMCHHILSDASYVSKANARSRAGGTFLFSAQPVDLTKPPSASAHQPAYNGAIHTISAIVANDTTSATEAEFGALFHNAHDDVPLRTALIEMGHP
jgi:hypothetical protein